MSASASSPAAAAGDEKQEAAPVRRCKGVNDLDKVVLREVRGSSAEVRTRLQLPLPLSCREVVFRLPDPRADPRRLPWRWIYRLPLPVARV